MATLYQVVPEMVAKPMGWGTFASMEDTHFVLCKYHDMSDDIPRKDFTALVADMHRRGVSPNGKFGNPNVTFGGRNPQLFPVTDTWEECFIHGMKAIFAAEKQTQGPDEELEYLEQAMIDQVFPRLLRALETGDRKIVPRLVHGDLWEGNTSVDRATGSPMIFDATPLYAHNECKYPSIAVEPFRV
jgi:fructosamine-3-kinase